MPFKTYSPLLVINRLEIVLTVRSPSPNPLPQTWGRGLGEGGYACPDKYETLNNADCILSFPVASESVKHVSWIPYQRLQAQMCWQVHWCLLR
jgi:hypothetical protein